MAATGRSQPQSRQDLTPEELAVRAQGGSLPAFSELVDRFEGRLYNFLLRRVGSAADAEDLTQETFLRAWQRIATYRPQWRFSTWLFTIGARLAVSRARRAPRRTEPMRGDLQGRHTDVGGQMDAGVQRTRIWALVDELLSQEQRTAVWLRYVEGMAMKDIARVMGKTQVAIRVMLFRARAVLAEGLGEIVAQGEGRPEPAVVRGQTPVLRGAS